MFLNGEILWFKIIVYVTLKKKLFHSVYKDLKQTLSIFNKKNSIHYLPKKR